MMVEYKTLRVEADDVEVNIDLKINELAKLGWELDKMEQVIGVSGVSGVSNTISFVLFFKRKVQQST